jgi:hypothetical protein
MDDGGKKHTAYSVEIYRYRDSNRVVSGRVCKECAGKNPDLTTGELLDLMLNPSLVMHSKGKFDYLLELAVNFSFVTVEQVAQAHAAAKPEQSVMDALLEKKLITPIQIATAKAAQFGAEIAVLREMSIDPTVISLVKPYFAWRYRIVPIEKITNHLVIAISDPSDLNTIDSLTHLLNAEIEIRVAAEDDLDEALGKYYPGEFVGLEEVTLPSK